MSSRNRCDGPFAPASPLRSLDRRPRRRSPRPTPAILASPAQFSGSSVPLCMREARVALEVERLDAFHIEPIHSSPSANWRLGAGDARRRRRCAAWRSSCACGRRSARGRARRARARRRRIRTRKPCALTVPRGARRVQQDVENDQDVGMADRLRELIDLVLDSLDEPANGAVAGAARALLARPPGPAAGRRDRRVAGGAAAAAAARARRVAAAHGRARRRPTPRRRPATARWRRSRARSPAPTGRRRARSTASWQLEAPNGIHFHPPAGLLIPGAREPLARRDLTDRHGLAPPRPRARAARGGGDARRARRWRATCGPGLVARRGSRARRPSAALMCERLVYTLEVWVAAIAGEPVPAGGGDVAAALRARGARLRAAREADPRPRRVRRRVRRRAVRAAAVVHLRRRALARAQLRRGPARGAGLRACPSSAPRCRVRRSDRVGGSERADADGAERDDVLRRRRAPAGRCSPSGGASRCSG